MKKIKYVEDLHPEAVYYCWNLNRKNYYYSWYDFYDENFNYLESAEIDAYPSDLDEYLIRIIPFHMKYDITVAALALLRANKDFYYVCRRENTINNYMTIKEMKKYLGITN